MKRKRSSIALFVGRFTDPGVKAAEAANMPSVGQEEACMALIEARDEIRANVSNLQEDISILVQG